MLPSSRAALGLIVRSVIAASLCTAGLAQQSAAPAPAGSSFPSQNTTPPPPSTKGIAPAGEAFGAQTRFETDADQPEPGPKEATFLDPAPPDGSPGEVPEVAPRPGEAVVSHPKPAASSAVAPASAEANSPVAPARSSAARGSKAAAATPNATPNATPGAPADAAAEPATGISEPPPAPAPAPESPAANAPAAPPAAEPATPAAVAPGRVVTTAPAPPPSVPSPAPAAEPITGVSEPPPPVLAPAEEAAPVPVATPASAPKPEGAPAPLPAPTPDPTSAPAPNSAPVSAPAAASATPSADQQTAPAPAESNAPAPAPLPEQTPAASTPAPAPATATAPDAHPDPQAPAPGPGTPDAPAPAPADSPAASAPASTSAEQGNDAQAVNPSLPSRQVNEPEPPPASRLDLFAGYTYLRPSGSIGIYKFPSNNTRGYIASGTYYFTRHFGVQAEYSHSEYPLGTTGTSPAPPFVQLGGVTDNFYTVEAGPVYRFFLGQHVVPFAHVTGGGARIAGPKFQPPVWGYGVTAGGGVDLILPHTHDHVAFRAAQADFEYMHADQGAIQQFDLAGGTQDVNALRLSAGFVFRFGEQNPVPSKGLACDANPSEVYSGEKVTLAANLRNYHTQHIFAYRWELSGGKQVGFGPVIFVDTAGLAGGTYHATAHISFKEKGKQFAQCSTSFVVKDSPAPTLKCSPNPSTVVPGEISTITSYAGSIAQRQLTYSYSTSEGQIDGTTETAQLHTDGLPPGVANITCRVRDDLGRTAVATTEVTISAPALPPAPKAQPLCTVYFNRDARRPARVDNEGRACLDDVALTMEHQPDARLVLVGEHSEIEADGQITAAERAINTRAYLANEKGIDPARVDVRTSTTPGRQVQTFLLAPGAVFDQPTEGRIDESKVKIHGQQYVNQRKRPAQGPAGEGVSHPPRQ